MNVWVGSGRLARDVKAADSGKQAEITLACDRPFPFGQDRNGNKVTDFLRLKILGEERASRAVKYLAKGVKIDVRGIVCHDSWKDKDGEWRDSDYIIVQEWEFAESKAASQEHSEGASSRQSNNAKAEAETGLDLSEDDDDFMRIDDDSDMGIPFE